MMLPAALTKGRAATLDEVAEYLCLTKRVVRNLCRKHAVPVLDTGAQLRFDELAFNALLEALRSRAMAAAARTPVPYISPALLRSPMGGAAKSADVLRRIESNLQQAKQRRRLKRASHTMSNSGGNHGNS
jgi:excisionase family DNA binding protein